MVGDLAAEDPESAIAAFNSSSRALRRVSLQQFEEWIEAGLETQKNGSAKARRSFFALETRRSNELLEESTDGLPLDGIATVLRVYVEGLTGREVEIAPRRHFRANPGLAMVGRFICPRTVNEFGNDELDFRLYKVLAAHGAGQIEFGDV